MKNYSVKATRNFKDAVENVDRLKNDVFLVTKERYEFLIEKNNAVELLAIIEKKQKEKKSKKK